MAVEDVKVPAKVFNTDPTGVRSPAPTQNSAEYWSEQAKAARNRREYLDENRIAREITDPPPPQENPFQIKGSVNLGEIDFQQQQREAEEARDRTRRDAEARIAAAETARDAANKALHDAQIQHLGAELGGQIQQLNAAIAAGNNRGGIEEQLMAITKLAGLLGFEKPDPGPTDMSLTLELKKMEHLMAVDARNFERQMKQDERMWQLELKKLEQLGREAEAKLVAEKEKYAAFSNIPERIGGIVAAGLIDRPEGGPPPSSASTGTKKKNAPATYQAEAAPGEAGELDCPGCGTKIGIGPTARAAECVNCHTRISIKRSGAPAEPQSEYEREDEGMGE